MSLAYSETTYGGGVMAADISLPAGMVLPSVVDDKGVWRERFEELYSACICKKSECSDDSDAYLRWCRFERELLEMDAKVKRLFSGEMGGVNIERAVFNIVKPDGGSGVVSVERGDFEVIDG